MRSILWFIVRAVAALAAAVATIVLGSILLASIQQSTGINLGNIGVVLIIGLVLAVGVGVWQRAEGWIKALFPAARE